MWECMWLRLDCWWAAASCWAKSTEDVGRKGSPENYLVLGLHLSYFKPIVAMRIFEKKPYESRNRTKLSSKKSRRACASYHYTLFHSKRHSLPTPCCSSWCGWVNETAWGRECSCGCGGWATGWCWTTGSGTRLPDDVHGWLWSGNDDVEMPLMSCPPRVTSCCGWVGWLEITWNFFIALRSWKLY